jgi:hypothetical protein
MSPVGEAGRDEVPWPLRSWLANGRNECRDNPVQQSLAEIKSIIIGTPVTRAIRLYCPHLRSNRVPTWPAIRSTSAFPLCSAQTGATLQNRL